ncbi:MAG: serpin family protein, partial [Armatimonadetes bacterium]|nr:serpin family protein [Armatimonadota bacterium]
VLDVNEQGTVAAAVTRVSVAPGPQPPLLIAVDHPFFLTIQDRPTGAILFMGSIVDPQ